MDFAKRRATLMEKITDGVLVLAAPPERRRSNDTFYPYRPGSDLWYLSGFEEPEAVLVLAPNHPEHQFVMFVRPRDREREIWDGFRFGPEGAVANFGADAAYPIAELEDRLPDLLRDQEKLYFSLGSSPRTEKALKSATRALSASRKKPDRAPHIIQNPRPIIHEMRRVKDGAEIERMGEAARISAAAHVAAMRATRPGVTEFEIQAKIEHVFRQHGASGPAYTSIVAAGANACCLHYVENKDTLVDGELLLVDAGAEYQMYAGDITRTWPVGAAFSGPQRDIYQAVLDVELAAIEDARPGISNHEMQKRAIRRLTQAMVDLGLLCGDIDGLIEQETYKRFYMHGIGHYLGIDVHDVGTYFVDDDEGLAFEPGVVSTIEPGLYIPADDHDVPEHFRGIGVRIEDDVVITNGAPRILTADVPKAIDEIEALRRDAMGK